eukprot:12300619-Alexandrium_andersonii.AAC.1
MADCGLRRIAALAGPWRIADCALGTLRCEDSWHALRRPGQRVQGRVGSWASRDFLQFPCSSGRAG